MSKLKRRAQSICAMVAAVATVAYYTDAAAYVEVDAAMKAKMVSEEMSVVEDMVSEEAIDLTENNTVEPVVKEEKETKDKTDYIVRTKTKKKLTKVNKKYAESTEINDNGQNLMEDNKMTSLKLSDAQAYKLEKDGKVKYIEEDVLVSASGKKESVKEKKWKSWHREKWYVLQDLSVQRKWFPEPVLQHHRSQRWHL